jgi:hypothetical protein
MRPNGVWGKWCCGQSVVGPVFLGVFLFNFVSTGGEKGGGNLPTEPPSYIVMLLCCFIVILLCCCVVVLLCCRVVILSVVVLLCCCVVVLLCCCVVVLLCCCVVVLLCCCVVVSVHT